VDNVYSHRSTQKYKRKPFVSHYWDCRLKGRPSGTPKSDDPNKLKRKRPARERDLCDVKIKITEYFPEMDTGESESVPPPPPVSDTPGNQLDNVGDPIDPALFQAGQQSGNARKKYYTIQRVNGATPGGRDKPTVPSHKHSLEESDRIKKNSVIRHHLKETKSKDKSKTTVSISIFPMLSFSRLGNSWHC
jgi:glutathione S-transferase